MKLFAMLEENAALYEWAQRLVSLNYRVFLRELRAERFFEPGKSVLDVGCGTGFLRDRLPTADYLGVDLNPAYIAAARRRRGEFFQVGNALELDRIPRRFDRVVCIGLLHHLDAEQVRGALVQCRARLLPGGEIFILDALWPPGRNSVGRALRASDNGAFVRTLQEWRGLFASELDVAALRPISQWPFDYVFVRAKGRCAAEPSLSENRL
jgi:SAM-dependent methyltransferase